MFTHAHVPMITYRVDVYRSRPIGASLLAGRGRPGADADRYMCAYLTQGLAGVVTGISAASIGNVLVLKGFTIATKPSALSEPQFKIRALVESQHSGYCFQLLRCFMLHLFIMS